MDTSMKIISFIEDTFLFGDTIHINKNESLTKNSIIDSTGVLELISFIEEKFNLDVNDEDITPENFDSIGGIEKYIKRNLP